MYCKKCGTGLAENAAFCHVCGTAANSMEKKNAINDGLNGESELLKNNERYTASDIFFVIVSLFVGLGGILPFLGDDERYINVFTLLPLSRELLKDEDIVGLLIIFLIFHFYAFGLLYCIEFVWDMASHKFVRSQGIYAIGSGIAFSITMLVFGGRYELWQTGVAWVCLLVYICAIVLLVFKQERGKGAKLLHKKAYILVQVSTGIVLLCFLYISFLRPIMYWLMVRPVAEQYSDLMIHGSGTEALKLFPEEIRDSVESQFISRHGDLEEYYEDTWRNRRGWRDAGYNETYEYSMYECERDYVEILEKDLEYMYGYKYNISVVYEVNLEVTYSKYRSYTIQRRMNFEVGLIDGKWYVVYGFLNWND